MKAKPHHKKKTIEKRRQNSKLIGVVGNSELETESRSLSRVLNMVF